jgi:hypothetical protein
MHRQNHLLPQVLEDDGESTTYVTDMPEEDELSLISFGAVEFWNQEVETELSDIISSNPNLERNE